MDRKSAFHEAGHVVAACVLGKRFIKAGLCRQMVAGVEAGGGILYEDMVFDRSRAIVALSGAAACAEFFGGDLSVWLNQVDYDNFARCMEGKDEADCYAYWFILQREAMVLMKEYRGLVEEVALFLLILGEITWQDAQHLLAKELE